MTNPQLPSTTAKPGRRSRRRLFVVAIGLLILLAGIVAAVVIALGGFKDKSKPPVGSNFRVTYPKTWRALTPAQLAAFPGRPATVLKRKVGAGLVVIRREGRLTSSNARLARDLDAQFQKRLPDYRKISANVLTIKAGRVFFFSYERTKKGSLNTVVVVPAGKQSYVIDTYSSARARIVATEIGRIIHSFELT